MKYAHIVQYVMDTPWAILPTKLTELLSVLAFRAAGHTFSAEEIEARIGKGSGGAGAGRTGAVAIIPIRGTIAHRMGAMDDTSGGTSTEGIASMFRQVMADGSVGTILLDVDSPGGTIPGVSELATEIRAARGQGKKIVAVANSLMASAAYWLASQADEIVAIPSARVGSIGVFTAHEDMSKALEQEGINVTLISAGKYKVEGNPFGPLTEEAKAMIQARVDDAYASFVADVALGRGVSAKAVQSGYGEGRALDAKGALAAGLIDRIGTMDAVIGEALGSSSATMRADVTDPALLAGEADRRRRLERF